MTFRHRFKSQNAENVGRFVASVAYDFGGLRLSVRERADPISRVRLFLERVPQFGKTP